MMEKCPFCGSEIKVIKGVLGTIRECSECGYETVGALWKEKKNDKRRSNRNSVGYESGI